MTTIDETLMGYSTFNEIDNRMLRAYNQYTVLTNMKESNLLGLMEEYLAKLDRTDRLGIAFLIEYIKRKGLEETKREIFVNGVVA